METILSFNNDAALATRGLPVWLINLQDVMFEGLPTEDHDDFRAELDKRIPVGVDLGPVQHWLAVSRINRMLETQRKALEKNYAHGVHDAIQKTIAAMEVCRRAHDAAASGNTCELSAAAEAALSARSSAESAARSSAAAAESAAWPKAWWAESAAWPKAWWAALSAASAAQAVALLAALSAESAARAAESAVAAAAWSAVATAAWSAESAWSETMSAAVRSAERAAWREERNALFAALDRAGAPSSAGRHLFADKGTTP